MGNRLALFHRARVTQLVLDDMLSSYLTKYQVSQQTLTVVKDPSETYSIWENNNNNTMPAKNYTFGPIPKCFILVLHSQDIVFKMGSASLSQLSSFMR